MHGGSYFWSLLSLLSLLALMFRWFRDVDAEATLEGAHTIPVQNGLNIGFIMFLISEVIVFVSVF